MKPDCKSFTQEERLQSYGYSKATSRKVAEMLTFADRSDSGQNCKPAPKPRSPEQRQATQEAPQAAQQQGQSFDQQPQQQVQEMGRQGGQAERKPQLPTCPAEEKPKG